MSINFSSLSNAQQTANVDKSKKSSKGKVLAALAAATAIGATVYAGLHGKKVQGDSFERTAKGVATAIGTGYKEIFGKVSNKISSIVDKQITMFKEGYKKGLSRFQNTEEVAQTVSENIEKAAEVIENAQ